MAVKKFKVSGVSDIFVNEGGAGAAAGIYNGVGQFPDPTANPGLFAIDSSQPGGTQGTLYCAFGGSWCVIGILAPPV